jgi:hypothetical protein
MNLNAHVFVLSLPKRWDLEDQSCVNKETMNFNRKLGKHLKSFVHAHYVEVNCDRKYTRHGLRLNLKGKEYVAKQLITFIEMKLNKNEKTVIPLNWKKDKIEKGDSKDRISAEEVLVTLSEDERKQHGKICSSLLSKRVRRQPANRSDDFLW